MFKTIKQIIFLYSFLLSTTFSLASASSISEIEKKLVFKKDDTTTYSLSGKGEGVRHKKVALFNIKVYKAQLFFQDDYVSKTSAAELLTAPVKGLKLLPLRSFGGDKLKEALLVSYEKNSIDPNTEYQKGFLDLISANKVEKDKAVYLMGISSGDKDEVIITVKDETKKVSGPNGFVNEIFKVWLGVPVDGDMVKLQDALTQP